MTDAERAARVMLGDLDQPDTDLRQLLEQYFRRLEMLSDGEQVVVDLALQLWNGGGSRTLGDALRWLDEVNVRSLFRALAILRPDAVASAALTVE